MFETTSKISRQGPWKPKQFQDVSSLGWEEKTKSKKRELSLKHARIIKMKFPALRPEYFSITNHF